MAGTESGKLECVVLGDGRGTCIRGTYQCPVDHERPLAVCEEAQRLIHGDREQDYGHPSVNFENIARQWTAYLYARYPELRKLDFVVHVQDVCNLMILLKVIREASTGQYKRDSVVDIAGYAGLKERLHDGT